MQKTYKVTYPSGLTDIETVDAGECPDVHAYANRKFGMPYSEVVEQGTIIAEVDEAGELVTQGSISEEKVAVAVTTTVEGNAEAPAPAPTEAPVTPVPSNE